MTKICIIKFFEKCTYVSAGHVRVITITLQTMLYFRRLHRVIKSKICLLHLRCRWLYGVLARYCVRYDCGWVS